MRISGLNSFTDTQEINFDKLTALGIFGIFGETGSGKSSIIDAMTMALFGRMPRFDTSNNRQFINTNTDSCRIYFQFRICETTYVVEREYKERSGKVKTNARFYELSEPIRIIADKIKEVNDEIESLIGLNYEDFSRSVVLPQGKFSEFLLLANKDRRNMLERIFNLEKYGERLNRKVHDEYNAIEKELFVLKTQMRAYEGINEALIKEKEDLLQRETLQLQILEANTQKLNRQFMNLTALQKNVEEYRQLLNQGQELEKEAEKAKETENKIRRANQAAKIVPILNNLRETDSIIKACTESLAEFRKSLDDTEQATKLLSQKLIDAKEVYEKQQPLLVKREYHILEAQKQHEQYKQLELTITQLRSQYKELKNAQKAHETQHALCIQQQSELSEKLIQVTQRKSTLTVLPEFRQKISEGLKIRDSLTELVKVSKTLETEIQDLSDRIAKEEKILAEKTEKLDSLKSQLADLEKKHGELVNSNPPDEETVVSLKMKLVDLQNRYEAEKAKAETVSQLKSRRDALLLTGENLLKSLESLQSRRESQSLIFQNAEEKFNAVLIHNNSLLLAEHLEAGKPCPVCGSLKHPNPAGNAEKTDLELINHERETAREALEDINSAITELNTEIALNNGEREGLDRQIKEAGVSDYNLEELEKIISMTRWESEQTGEKLKDYRRELSSLESLLNNCRIMLPEIQSETVACSERILKDKQLLSAKKSDLGDKTSALLPLGEKLQIILSELQTDDIQKEYSELCRKDRELAENDTEEKSCRAKLEEIRLKADELSTQIQKSESQLQDINTVGREKRLQADSLKEEIAKVLGDKTPEELLQEIRRELSRLDSEVKNLTAEREKLMEQKHGCEQNITQSETRLETQAKLKIHYEGLLKEEFQRSEFQNDAEAEESLLDEGKIAEFEEKLRIYHEERLKVAQNTERLKAILDESQIPWETVEAECQSVSEQLAEAKSQTETKTKETAVLSNSIQTMKQQLETVRELAQRQKETQHQADLLKLLADLFKGNRFVEFVAQRHLRYIVCEASVKLKEMTSGRYALQLVGSDFAVRDDYNGGELRSPRTLSGGEIFVTSLCLALALSSKIKLKSNAGLEFFFLDEGFGTLDASLLDTVISALEHLKNDNMTVGVISHVEELKNRMPVKLLVTPPVFGVHGTKVKMSM